MQSPIGFERFHCLFRRVAIRRGMRTTTIGYYTAPEGSQHADSQAELLVQGARGKG